VNSIQPSLQARLLSCHILYSSSYKFSHDQPESKTLDAEQNAGNICCNIFCSEVSLNLRALVSLFSVFVEINKAENAIITMYIKTKFVSEIFFLKIPFLQASYIKYFFVRHV